MGGECKMSINQINGKTELLIELFSAEIPARMQEEAASSMLSLLTKEINYIGLEYKEAQYFVTPRRVTLYINGLDIYLPAKTINKKGPKLDARKEAIEGFLKSVDMTIDQLSLVDGFYYANKLEPEQDSRHVIAKIVEQLLVSFTWPKSMRLSSSRHRWVRPLQNILCIFDKKILPINFFNLNSNNYSYGHRFMMPGRLEINSFDDYLAKMKQSYVVLSSEERRKLLIKQASAVANSLNLELVMDAKLLNEVAGLVEFPNILLGKIEEKFINLPKEVLITAMKIHQRYFHLQDKNGKIAPYFLFAANVKGENDALIIQGNEKVLKARLADAQFFLERDLKLPISESLAKLAKMIFHHKLGNMFEKTNRIITFATFIAEKVGNLNIDAIKKAALLCKTDLVSEMVGEFPELQGIMGQYYAQYAGEDAEVSLAIAQHYRPIDVKDKGDIARFSAVIAIADKLDSIFGLWIAGEKPSSSKDPFALRRSVLGVIKLIRYHQFDLSLKELLEEIGKAYNDNHVIAEILLFFNERLKHHFKGENFRHDIVQAVLQDNVDNIHDANIKLIQLQEFIDNNPKAENIIIAIKRILKIIAEYQVPLSLEVNQSLFTLTEQKLYQKIKEKPTTLEGLSNLSSLIDQFFTETLVNDPNTIIRTNRYNLLYNIIDVAKEFANFNLIQL
jgi:glycyl-tRNA synthetase beta chain